MNGVGRAAVLAAGFLGLASCGSVTAVEGPSAEQIPAGGHLDVQVWAVGNSSEAVSRALAPFEGGAVPLTGALLDRFRANGLRVLAVPVGELGRVRNALPTAGPSEQRRLVETTDWAVAVEGPLLGRGTPARMDSGILTLDEGRLRLLTRAWTAPVFDGSTAPSAGLRLDVVVEHAAPARRDEFELLPTLRAPERTAFERLSFELLLDGSTAIVLVPEEPTLTFAGQAESHAKRNEPVEADEPRDIGPPAPFVQTLGGLMLGGRKPGEPGAPRRIVVLRPVLGERFHLLPD